LRAFIFSDLEGAPPIGYEGLVPMVIPEHRRVEVFHGDSWRGLFDSDWTGVDRIRARQSGKRAQ